MAEHEALIRIISSRDEPAFAPPLLRATPGSDAPPMNAGELASTGERRHRRTGAGLAAEMFCCGWGGNQFTPLLIMYQGRTGTRRSPVTRCLAPTWSG